MLTSNDFYKRFGEPGLDFERKEMSSWHVPDYCREYIQHIPVKIYCNKQMHVPLETAFYNILAEDLGSEIKTWDGCFNVRAIRGRHTLWDKYVKQDRWDLAAKYTSVHAWGCAIDINAAWNRLGEKPTMSKNLVKCFTDAGFVWGGEWNRPDGMHFQLEYIN